MKDKNKIAESEEAFKLILNNLGEDTGREGLLETPKRFISFWNDFLSPPPFEMTTFDSEGTDQMICQFDIPFYSICEHHGASIIGFAHLGYVPSNKILGLSKLARTVEKFSRRMTNQERLCSLSAEFIMNDPLKPLGVGCIISARHLCMEMRGVRKPGTTTTTSKLLGVFKTDPIIAQRFWDQVNSRNK